MWQTSVISQTRTQKENRSCDYILQFCKVLLLVVHRFLTYFIAVLLLSLLQLPFD